MSKEIRIKINEEDIINGDFKSIDETTGELILNIQMDDLKRKRIEKLDKAHRGMINKSNKH